MRLPPPPAWLVHAAIRLADFADRLPPRIERRVWLAGEQGIEYIEDTVVGDRLIFHPREMGPFRHRFTWGGERFVAIVDRGDVAVMRAADLEPGTIPCVWRDDWWVEP